MFRHQLRKELHELWATRKALIALVVMLAFGMISPISAKLLPDLLDSIGEGQQVQIIVPEPTLKDALDQFVKNAQQMLMFMVLLLSFGTVVAERERGLMTMTFPHGLSRPIFVLAKFTALVILLGLGMIGSAGVTYFYSSVLFEPPEVLNFVGIALLLYIYLVMFAALGILGSTLGRTTFGAAGITFGLVLMIILPSLFISFAPTALTQWAISLAAGDTGSSQWGALLCTIALTLGAVMISCVSLQRQEIMAGNNP